LPDSVVAGKRSSCLLDGVGRGGSRCLSRSPGEEARPGSDLDLLVDFEPEASLLDHIGLYRDLESLLGVRVDVIDRDGLSPRDTRIRNEALPL
jgi:predicted nucleotidyltransferase